MCFCCCCVFLLSFVSADMVSYWWTINCFGISVVHRLGSLYWGTCNHALCQYYSIKEVNVRTFIVKTAIRDWDTDWWTDRQAGRQADTQTDTHTHTHTHACMHARTHACTHARMLAHTHTHTHSEYRFPAPSSKLCQIWLCHWRGTLYLLTAVQQCSQRPSKGLGTDYTVEAT